MPPTDPFGREIEPETDCEPIALEVFKFASYLQVSTEQLADQMNLYGNTHVPIYDYVPPSVFTRFRWWLADIRLKAGKLLGSWIAGEPLDQECDRYHDDYDY